MTFQFQVAAPKKRFGMVSLLKRIIPLVLILPLLREVNGDFSMTCFRPPVGDGIVNATYENLTSLGLDKFPNNGIYWDTWWKMVSLSNAYSYDWDMTKYDSSNPSSYGFTFTLYPLRAGGRRLNGWFRLKVGFNDGQFESNFRDRIRSFVLNAQNSMYEDIGEWLTNVEFLPRSTKKCPRNDATRYMAINCGGAYPSQPSVSNVLVYVKNDTQADSSLRFPLNPSKIRVVPFGQKSELNFYFRHSVQFCNTLGVGDGFPKTPGIHFTIRAVGKNLKGNFNKSETDVLLVNKITYYAKDTGNLSIITGASDPTPPSMNDLDCSSTFAIKEDETTSTAFDWWADNFSKDKLRHPINKYFSKYYGCQGDYFGGRCPHNICHRLALVDADFQTNNKQNMPNITQVPKCHPKLLNTSAFTFHPRDSPPTQADYFKTAYYDEYTTTANHTKTFEPCPTDEEQCENKIILVDFNNETNEDLKPIKRNSRTWSSGVVQQDYSHDVVLGDYIEEDDYNYESDDPVSKEKDKYKTYVSRTKWVYDKTRGVHVSNFTLVWDLRQAHGIIMIILTMFLFPVSNFIVRYFKESFMHRRIFYVRVWYMVHTHMSGWIFVFTVGGSALAYVARDCLGKSLAGVATSHRIFAYFSFVVFFILFITSGLRNVDESSRKLSIIFHWALGILLYALNLTAVVTSVWIPASPLALIDHQVPVEDKKNVELNLGLKSGLDMSPLFVYFWILFEACIHVFMTMTIKVSDKKMKVVEARAFYPVPIPVIRENATDNATGERFRIIMLLVYVIISFSITLALCCIILFGSDHEGRGYGPMYCTHTSVNGIIEMKLPKLKSDCLDASAAA